MRGAVEPVVSVLGVRHHGPGSARAVAAALDELRPDALLIEGPAEADALVALAASEAMVPPVALLAYAPDAPGISAFWPFAEFSPEWQALRWAGRRGVPVRFCDLPAAAMLAGGPEGEELPPDDSVRTDPIARLAHAAGYDDPERWWDDLVEARPGGAFDAIAEAMAALREDAPPEPPAVALREERREAHMRQVLRATVRAGAQRVVVVCGAWHVPALAGRLGPASADAQTLKGLPKRKVVLTWVPWTHSRLDRRSGYGAGVESPGWYHHLFTHPEHPITRWMTRVAGVLRAKDLPVSSAHVIESVRLAETLAVLRRRPLAGLAEVTEAALAVLCEGDEVALNDVTAALVVGEQLGSVPDDAPTVPLVADLRASVRRLRLKMEALARSLDLDLRTDNDRARSVLLHRLLLVGVAWGEPAASEVASTGTFRESWQLAWSPTLELRAIEASVWGSTVEEAAAARVIAAASGAPPLVELTGLVGGTLRADLPAALDALLRAVTDRAARDSDVAHLMGALPALVRAARYGDVRGTDVSALRKVADTLAVRICAGLPAAVASLDDDGAEALRGHIENVHAALALHDADAALAAASTDADAALDRWYGTLLGLVDRADVNGLLVGRAVRLLRDAGRLLPDEAADRLARALSVGSPPVAKAAWVQGFLAGGGLLLVHDRDLLTLLDRWVSGLDGTAFLDVLPLVRRAFGAFAVGERRAIGEAVRSVAAGRAEPASDGWEPVDERRAAPVLATVAMLLGIEVGTGG